MKTGSGTPYWSRPAADLLAELRSSESGLVAEAARRRLAETGPNAVEDRSELPPWRLLARQFESPLVLILVFGACVSLVLRQWVDAGIILAIVTGSALLSFRQEFRASKAVAEL